MHITWSRLIALRPVSVRGSAADGGRRYKVAQPANPRRAASAPLFSPPQHSS